MYGSNADDPSLIAGKPAGIRSDEWLVWTQITISQSENNFSKFNDDLSNGRDLSLHFEIPTKDWSAIFKPQNWSYFVLPIEYAFAFKWWFLMYVLITGAYFFILKMLPGRHLFASIVSIAFALSPFILWWYQSAVLLLMGYGLYIILTSMKIIEIQSQVTSKKTNKTRMRIFLTALLAFLLTCFALILYPPFQISIAIVILFFMLGYLFNIKKKKALDIKGLFKSIYPIIIALVFVGIVSLIFISDKKVPIERLNDSIYPGQRVVVSGSNNPLVIPSGFLMPLLEFGSRAPFFVANQSEASNFILVAPFLILPFLFLLGLEYKKYKRIDWLSVSLLVLALLLLTRILIPFGDDFYRLLLLDKVPHRRLVIALGFLGFLMIIQYFKKFQEIKPSFSKKFYFILFYSALCAGVLALVGKYVHQNYPLFLKSKLELLVLLCLFIILVATLASGKKMLFAFAFLFITLISSFRIMPLYRGLGPIYHSDLKQTIENVSMKDDTWLTVGTKGIFYYEQVPILSGRKSLSGVQLYPEPKFWTDAYGKKYESAFNRKAHIVYEDNNAKEKITLPYPNRIVIEFSCKDNFIKDNVDYVLTLEKLTEPCLSPLKEINYPNVSFYIYKMNHSN